MYLVPRMDETVLCKIVGQRLVACQLAQEIANLGLVPPDQFPECTRVLARDDLRNEYLVVDRVHRDS